MQIPLSYATRMHPIYLPTIARFAYRHVYVYIFQRKECNGAAPAINNPRTFPDNRKHCLTTVVQVVTFIFNSLQLTRGPVRLNYPAMRSSTAHNGGARVVRFGLTSLTVFASIKIDGVRNNCRSMAVL